VTAAERSCGSNVTELSECVSMNMCVVQALMNFNELLVALRIYLYVRESACVRV
jgi:hypothetical protein